MDNNKGENSSCRSHIFGQSTYALDQGTVENN